MQSHRAAVTPDADGIGAKAGEHCIAQSSDVAMPSLSGEQGMDMESRHP